MKIQEDTKPGPWSHLLSATMLIFYVLNLSWAKSNPKIPSHMTQISTIDNPTAPWPQNVLWVGISVIKHSNHFVRSMEIRENLWTSMCKHKSMNIYVKTCEHLLGSMEICEYMRICGRLCEHIGVYVVLFSFCCCYPSQERLQYLNQSSTPQTSKQITLSCEE